MRFSTAFLLVLASMIFPRNSFAQAPGAEETPTMEAQPPKAQGSGVQNDSAQQKDPKGYWQGAIELPNGELGINVLLRSDDGKAWSGTIDIPAQGLQGFELSNVSAEGPKVHFEMNGVPGQPTFEGELTEAGDAIAGTFRQGPQSLAFALQRSSEAPAQGASLVDVEKVPGKGIPGEWLGVLDVGPVNLRLVLRAKGPEDGGDPDGGSLTATLESVDQSSTIPVDSIKFTEATLSLVLNRIASSYKGVMNEDGSAVQGIWTQGGRNLPLTFHRLAEPFALARPQNPKPPFPYESREVTFQNESAKISLAGTLLLPEGEGPFPAVLFVTGSGPQDRNETIMGHQPFLVLADHLARHGIASLRYDDRGVGESQGDHMGSTVGDFATDVAAGIAYLAQQPKIDRKAVGIVGHSEGGLSGPIAATQSKEVDFLVLLAPPGEPLRDLVLRQNRDHLETLSVEPALKQKVLASQEKNFEVLLDTSLSQKEATETLLALAAEQKKELTKEEMASLQINDAMIEQGIRQMTTPWFRSLLQEDPVTHLKAIKIPTFVLFGEKDIQVVPQINAKLVEGALQAAGNPDYEVQVLPDLNHLFQHAKTGKVEEYSGIEETFSPEALESISSWIGKRFKPTS